MQRWQFYFETITTTTKINPMNKYVELWNWYSILWQIHSSIYFSLLIQLINCNSGINLHSNLNSKVPSLILIKYYTHELRENSTVLIKMEGKQTGMK